MYHVIQLISYHLLFFKSLLVLSNLSDFWVIKICELGAEQIPLGAVSVPMWEEYISGLRPSKVF